MGCDIHFVVETQHTDGTWVGVFSSTGHYDWTPPWDLRRNASPFWKFDDRDYRFFAALAGVRGEGPVPLDCPEDMSSLARMGVENWDGDGHSHSWLPLYEFVRRWLTSNPERLTAAVTGKLEGEQLDPVFTAVNLNPKFEEDVELMKKARVVFWFDN